MNTNTNS